MPVRSRAGAGLGGHDIGQLRGSLREGRMPPIEAGIDDADAHALGACGQVALPAYDLGTVATLRAATLIVGYIHGAIGVVPQYVAIVVIKEIQRKALLQVALELELLCPTVDALTQHDVGHAGYRAFLRLVAFVTQ